MKKIILLVALFCAGFTYAQNQSAGPVQPAITTPIPQQFGGAEMFRFSKGLVTQLDSGTAFDFSTSRWFSLGSLNTGSQTVYGIRFQLPKKAITLGFQDLNDNNPRIQWIGSNNNNLEFRAANSFTSTTSTLNATMTYDGRTFFGKPLASNEPLVGIDYSTVPGNTKTGLIVRNNTNNGTVWTGIKTINKEKGKVKTGISVVESGDSLISTGVAVSVETDGGDAVGVDVAAKSATKSTFGVRSDIGGGVSTLPLSAAIFGSAAAVTNRFAGYFNGNVFVTGTFTVSDERLKENIKAEENVLDKLSQLETVTYTFKQNDNLNLSSQLQHGFLAQNLEEVFPELVTSIEKPVYDKKDAKKQVGTYEYKAVNYTGLISVLASSLKEMNNKMTVMETEIADLRNELANTKNRLEGQNDLEVGFSMEQNRPNPFTNQTVINYTLPQDAKATISVFDMSGKFIRDYNLASQKGKERLVLTKSEKECLSTV
jgi:hypothetical protein